MNYDPTQSTASQLLRQQGSEVPAIKFPETPGYSSPASLAGSVGLAQSPGLSFARSPGAFEPMALPPPHPVVVETANRFRAGTSQPMHRSMGLEWEKTNAEAERRGAEAMRDAVPRVVPSPGPLLAEKTFWTELPGEIWTSAKAVPGRALFHATDALKYYGALDFNSDEAGVTDTAKYPGRDYDIASWPFVAGATTLAVVGAAKPLASSLVSAADKFLGTAQAAAGLSAGGERYRDAAVNTALEHHIAGENLSEAQIREMYAASKRASGGPEMAKDVGVGTARDWLFANLSRAFPLAAAVDAVTEQGQSWKKQNLVAEAAGTEPPGVKSAAWLAAGAAADIGARAIPESWGKVWDYVGGAGGGLLQNITAEYSGGGKTENDWGIVNKQLAAKYPEVIGKIKREERAEAERKAEKEKRQRAGAEAGGLRPRAAAPSPRR